MPKKKPALLLILDGWGASDNPNGNAIFHANTPNWDRILSRYPNCTIEGCGSAVGLPEGQIGNSEVGHLTMGSGRIIHQDLSRINHAIQDGSFFHSSVLKQAFKEAQSRSTAVHIMGLLSPGGVHSHEDHIQALLQMTNDYQCPIYVHAFLDGRDTPPKCATTSLEKLSNQLEQLPHAHLATVVGRYYAMDRDKRWDRVASAFDAIVFGKAETHTTSISQLINQNYEKDVTDEFMPPCAMLPNYPGIQQQDTVIFMNFRADRARQICHALTDSHFEHFDRGSYQPVQKLVTLTQYDDTLDADVIYPKSPPINTLGAFLSDHHYRQLRIAETEKYAHVTFFFNGGVEEPSPNEERILIPSPKVRTYDLKPEMSAHEVCDRLIEAISSQAYDVIICNFANADMVGHTGSFSATIQAIEVLDDCLGRIVDALQKHNGSALITADHGNADCMFADDPNNPHTAHTMAKVPFVYVGADQFECISKAGSLQDIAPTLLYIMDLTPPPEMTGQSLLKEHTE